MIDEIYDRHFQAARADLNTAIVSGIARLGRGASNAFAVLNRIEYSAPWALPTKKAR